MSAPIFDRINAADEQYRDALVARDQLVLRAVALGHSYSEIFQATGIAKSSIHAIVSRVGRDGTR